MSLLKTLETLFFPKSCVFCKTPHKYICDICLDSIYFIYQPFCCVCQKPSLEGATHLNCKTYYKPQRLLVPFYYQGVVQSVVKKAKYYKKEFALIYELINYALLYSEQFNFHLLTLDFVIVPIPSDKNRFKKRGFNLPSVIGIYLAKKLNLGYAEILQKDKELEPLFGLTKHERKKAIKGAFNLKANVTQVPKKVLLVDDILTTGATLNEAALVLKRAGVKHVWCFALSYRSLYKN